MRIIRKLGLHKPADGRDFRLGDFRRLAIERYERNGAIRTKRVVIAIEGHAHEKIILEERLFDDLVAVAPPAPNLVRGEKRFDLARTEFFAALPFMARSSVEGV